MTDSYDECKIEGKILDFIRLDSPNMTSTITVVD